MGRKGETFGRLSRTSGREYYAQSRKQPGCGVSEPYWSQPPAPQRIPEPATLRQITAQSLRQRGPPETEAKSRQEQGQLTDGTRAIRSSEITVTATPGSTKIIRLEGVVFRDSKHREIPHASKQDLQMARRVTVTLENQKNGLKMDK